MLSRFNYKSLIRLLNLAFRETQRWELPRASGSAGRKQFWAWDKAAELESQQLRETERLNREHRTQDADNFTLLRRKISSHEFADILPITTLAAFAPNHPPPAPRFWFQSQMENEVSTSVEPPVKRFSVTLETTKILSSYLFKIWGFPDLACWRLSCTSLANLVEE